jgi:hypothetical protein
VTPAQVLADRIVGLSTAAADRVYMLILPQKLGTWPAVRLQDIPSVRGQHLRGPQYPVQSRVQVDHYQQAAAGVDALGIVAALAAEVRGDGLGDGASGIFGWRGESQDSPATVKVLNVELIQEGNPFYEPGEMRLARIRDEYLIHWTHMN